MYVDQGNVVYQKIYDRICKQRGNRIEAVRQQVFIAITYSYKGWYSSCVGMLNVSVNTKSRKRGRTSREHCRRE